MRRTAARSSQDAHAGDDARRNRSRRDRSAHGSLRLAGKKVRADAGIIVNVEECDAVLRQQRMIAGSAAVKRYDAPGLSTRDTLATAAACSARGR